MNRARGTRRGMSRRTRSRGLSASRRTRLHPTPCASSPRRTCARCPGLPRDGFGAGRRRATSGRTARCRSRASACSMPAPHRAARPAICSSVPAVRVEVTALDVSAAAARSASGRTSTGSVSQAHPRDRRRRAPADWWDGRPFDRILLDVPCSATGVIRRHPDIKLLRRAKDIPALARRQRDLLDAAWAPAEARRHAAVRELLGAGRGKRAGRRGRSWRAIPRPTTGRRTLTAAWPPRPAGGGARVRSPARRERDGRLLFCLPAEAAYDCWE